MIENNFLKNIYLKFILFSCLLFLIGCEVRPNEVVKSFLDSVKEKKLHNAGNFCTAELRESLDNFPSAYKSYMYGTRIIDFNFTDLQKTKEGMVAIVKVKVDRPWPPPKDQAGLLWVFLKRIDNKWYINSINIDTYLIKFNKKPIKAVNPKINNGRPFWITDEKFSGNLRDFLVKYDKYCKEWEQ